jgi:hypothetical protein
MQENQVTETPTKRLQNPSGFGVNGISEAPLENHQAVYNYNIGIVLDSLRAHDCDSNSKCARVE